MRQFKRAVLLLEDGTTFEGKSFGYEASTAGEVVFNTAMTGYPESLTDPSYEGQILVTTYPILGNYGVPPRREKDDVSEYYESDKIHCQAIVAQDYSYDIPTGRRTALWPSGCRRKKSPESTALTHVSSPSISANMVRCSAK